MSELLRDLQVVWRQPVLRRRNAPDRVEPSRVSRPTQLKQPCAVVAVERLQLAVPLARLLAELGFATRVVAGGEIDLDPGSLGPEDLVVLDCWHEDLHPDVLRERFASRPELLGRCVVVESPKLSLDAQRRLLRLGVLAVLPRNRFDERLRALLERRAP